VSDQPKKEASKAKTSKSKSSAKRVAKTSADATPAAEPASAQALHESRSELRRNMMRSIVTEPLLTQINDSPDGVFDVIIALNELYQGGLEAALAEVKRQAEAWQVKYSSVSNYVFARLSAERIRLLAIETQHLITENRRSETVVYRIWEDSDVATTLTRSLTTIKADAAQRSFHALGEGIVWAVLDSGIDGDHVHFEEKHTLHGRIDSLGIRAPVAHRDYTPDGEAQLAERSPASDNERRGTASALLDRLGHGTHVAGIITGYWKTD